MKKSLFIVTLLLSSVFTFAQQQLATLNHNDSISVYYGNDALVSAHNAAVNGDIITLSSGFFNSVNITKAITIRGAGAWTGTNNNGNTVLRNDFTITIPDDSVYHLILEGLYTFNNMKFQTAYNPQFIKCHFKYFYASGNNSYMNNATFFNCIVERWDSHGDSYPDWRAHNTQFINSIILLSCYITGTGGYYNSPDIFSNCILHQHPKNSLMNSRSFQNCILYYNGTDSYLTENSYSAYNSLFIQTNTNSSANLFSGLAGHNLWNKKGFDSVFKHFNGSNAGDLNFELLDTIAATCIGSDGKQIGVYGGLMPFDPQVTNPMIRSINVGQRSTPDGKLAVDIEVVSEGTENDSTTAEE